jgi:hypothetical protein
MAISDEEFELANQCGEESRARFSPAVEVRYDEPTATLLIRLESGVSIVVPAAAIQGLEAASPEQRGHVEISPAGLGIHFPALDVDIYLPALLEGSLGTKRWMATRRHEK